MIVNADLHIHSRYSGATSRKMTLETLSIESKKKGIDLLATGDCLHPLWLKEIRALREIDDGTFEMNGTHFILSAEVEDSSRVHHLLYFPALTAVEEFIRKVKSKTLNLTTDGRPTLRLAGEQIAGYAEDVDALIGPSHGFTPWTAIYAYHDSLASCYGSLSDYISFIELGLSADTEHADRISELHRLTFLTNSDAHSPFPLRLAREFNRFEIDTANFACIKAALLREEGTIVLNVGLPPQEGKYHESACIKCLAHYTLVNAKRQGWRCTCRGLIKKGVKDRIEELADIERHRHPAHRPRYLRLIPLAEVIAKAVGHSSPFTKTVFARWNELINAFDNEVRVLVDEDIEVIGEATTEPIKNAIAAFRKGDIIIHPGGGGVYGKLELPKSDDIAQAPQVEVAKKPMQRTLFDY